MRFAAPNVSSGHALCQVPIFPVYLIGGGHYMWAALTRIAVPGRVWMRRHLSLGVPGSCIHNKSIVYYNNRV
jgi:hypothetical protein